MTGLLYLVWEIMLFILHLSLTAASWRISMGHEQNPYVSFWLQTEAVNWFYNHSLSKKGVYWLSPGLCRMEGEAKQDWNTLNVSWRHSRKPHKAWHGFRAARIHCCSISNLDLKEGHAESLLVNLLSVLGWGGECFVNCLHSPGLHPLFSPEIEYGCFYMPKMCSSITLWPCLHTRCF